MYNNDNKLNESQLLTIIQFTAIFNYFCFQSLVEEVKITV